MRLQIALALALLLVNVVAPAAADEGAPDCEPDQWWPWRGAEPLRQVYAALGAPGGLELCEGEHWDGQDTVRPEEDPGDEAPCLSASVDNASSGGVAWCMGPDPNRAGPDGANVSSGRLVTARGAWASDGAAREAYLAGDVLLVGRAALYVGTDEDRARAAVYVRDNTPHNIVATLVSAIGASHHYVAEGDCTHAEYQWEYGRPPCGRDNTALTVGAALP